MEPLSIFRAKNEYFTTANVLRLKHKSIPNSHPARRASCGNLARTDVTCLADVFLPSKKNASAAVSLASIESELEKWGFHIPTEEDKQQAPVFTFNSTYHGKSHCVASVVDPFFFFFSIFSLV